MVNLFYYCSMGLVWLLLALVLHGVLGAWFWPLLGINLAAGAWIGRKRNQAPRA
ncbi:hypothetical protein ACNQFN_11535 [Thauera butanivorans]|uniref:hypothetical protein n=1 Tax=Thauera butanivorans TaxID=86174 RepID=UPI003AB1B19B